MLSAQAAWAHGQRERGVLPSQGAHHRQRGVRQERRLDSLGRVCLEPGWSSWASWATESSAAAPGSMSEVRASFHGPEPGATARTRGGRGRNRSWGLGDVGTVGRLRRGPWRATTAAFGGQASAKPGDWWRGIALHPFARPIDAPQILNPTEHRKAITWRVVAKLPGRPSCA